MRNFETCWKNWGECDEAYPDAPWGESPRWKPNSPSKLQAVVVERRRRHWQWVLLHTCSCKVAQFQVERWKLPGFEAETWKRTYLCLLPVSVLSSQEKKWFLESYKEAGYSCSARWGKLTGNLKPWFSANPTYRIWAGSGGCGLISIRTIVNTNTPLLLRGVDFAKFHGHPCQWRKLSVLFNKLLSINCEGGHPQLFW